MGSLTTVGARTPGSDERKTQMLVKMKSMIVAFGCPCIYITINSAQDHSPIVLKYAGKDIDPFPFVPAKYNATERLKIALENPHAVNDYFDTMIRLMIKCLFAEGLFGKMIAYFGVKEYQGRGAPHVHMVLWMSGFLNPAELRERARTDAIFQA